jgi:hypothetical protein
VLNSFAIASDTSSAAAEDIETVGATAIAVAAATVDSIRVKFAVAALTMSGHTNTKDIGALLAPDRLPEQWRSPNVAKSLLVTLQGCTGVAQFGYF